MNGGKEIVVLYAGEIEEGLILGQTDDAHMVALVKTWLRADQALQDGMIFCNEGSTQYDVKASAVGTDESNARAGPRKLAVMRFSVREECDA